MATKDNGSIVRENYEAFNRRDLDAAASACSDDMKWQNVSFGQTYRGPQGMKDYLNNWLKGFPDARVEIVNLVESGEWVTCELVGRGTHNGTLNGPAGPIPPTGKSVEVRMCEVHRLRGGKVIDGRSYFDSTTMMRQLGLL